MTTTEPPTFAELRQRILDGGDVTPEEYERARVLAELDELQQQADQRAATRQAEAERAARFDDLRTRARGILDQRQQRDTLADTLRQTLAEMIRIQDAMEADRDAVISGLLAEGIRPGNEDHGIGWANADAFTQADHIRLDGNRVALGNIRVPIQDALAGALADTGKVRGYIGAIAPGRPR